MKLSIELIVQEKKWKARLPSEAIRAACKAAFKEGFRIQDSGFGKNKEYEVTVVLANDASIQELNHTYRGKKKPTNVLSFPSQSPESRNLNPESCLGDIIMAYETIESEAKEQGKTFKDHATHLIVHGVLHLLGHDHMRKSEAEAMEEKEIKILKKLGVRNPYL